MSTPYYKKASWIKKMSQAAKRERLERERKEAEQKKVVKEESIQEADEIQSSDYKLSPTGRKVRAKHIIFKSQDDDEQKEKDDDEQKEKDEKMNEEKDYHTVKINGRRWKTFDSKAHAQNVAKKIKGATVHKYSEKEAEQMRAAHGAKLAAKNAARGKEWDEGVEMDNTKQIEERSMTDAEMKKREEIVKSMKKKIQGFKDRYGDRAKEVMYATATKMAMKEENQLDELDKSTLASYIKKSSSKQFTAGHKAATSDSGSEMKAINKAQKRSQGVAKAVDRLTKEEMEIEEATKYVVKYHTAKGEHKNTSKAFDSKQDAQSHAARGNAIDKVGGKYTVHSITEGIEMQEAKEPPFEGGVPAKGTVKDKSGAKHTPMSRARDLARQAMKKQVKEGYGLDITDEQADDLIAESFLDTVNEQIEQLDELSPKTLKSYVKGAGKDVAGNRKDAAAASEKAASAKSAYGISGSKFQSDIAKRRAALADKREGNIEKAKARLTKEEYEGDLEEAMISYSDFHAKLAAHRKAGNDIADSHYGTKKAHYTVVDKEGTARKVTHTETGSKMENLGKHKGEVEDESGNKVQKTVHEPAVKRGRGRPAGQTGLKYKPRDPASKAASAAKAAATKAANRAKQTK